MERENKQKKLQEILSAARGALEEALEYAKENDLYFEFTGLRRGPEYDDESVIYSKDIDVNDPEIFNNEDIKGLPVVVSKLDVNHDWLSSYC